MLRVYLGAAPGVGKTVKMLEEGHRRSSRGTDVVIGVVETHGRSHTASLIDGLEVVPRRAVTHRGVVLEEMDLDAIVERAPDVVLVDELAHTNPPGGRHEKRWQDVEALLDAGIDVITTVNIQHLDSLNDALERITGVEQKETVPDDVVRRADQVELVDMTPEALRRRIRHGNVYPAERVDAALGNYFRIGNLTALRELALLWVADRVDDELLEYRQEQGIQRPWETRERIVVALTGSASGEAVIRRAARIAERTRADLIGVHVRRSDGLGDEAADGRLADHQRLVVELGGRYHEIVGAEPGAELVAFARAENATQLVLGASGRSRIDELLHGSVIAQAVRAAPDIDIHVVAPGGRESWAVADAPPRRIADGRPRRSSRPTTWSMVPMRRRVAAVALAILGPFLLTLAFIPFRAEEGLPGVLPSYLLVVVLCALLGGTWPAVLAAVVGFVFGNVALTQPYGTLRITAFSSLVGLTTFLVLAVVIAVLVGRLSARTAEIDRIRAQARALAAAAATVGEDDAILELLDQLRVVLGCAAVALVEPDGSVGRSVGDEAALSTAALTSVELATGQSLVTAPPVTDPDERAVVRAFGDQLVAAARRNEQALIEREARLLGEVDNFRTALLRSVSHDLRTPLASIKAAASSLQQDDVEWPADARADFLATIVEESDRLDRIIGNLLDASRLEAGVLAVEARPVHLDEIVAAVVSASSDPGRVAVDVGPHTAPACADPALLERVVENLVANALRYTTGSVEVDVVRDADADVVALRVIDHGAGVPPAAHAAMFTEFQRLGDSGPGVGLGLAVAQGFARSMGATIEASETPGGGLTMAVLLPAASAVATDGSPVP
jgi:two-component system sensor histidine kinase KdpD